MICDYCDHAATGTLDIGIYAGDRVCDVHATLPGLLNGPSSALCHSLIMATRAAESDSRKWRTEMRGMIQPIVIASDRFGGILESILEDRMRELPLQ